MPAKAHRRRQARLLRRRQTLSHAECRASLPQRVEQSRREFPRSHSKTRASNARLSILAPTAAFRFNILRSPQSLRAAPFAPLCLRHQLAPPRRDGRMEIRRGCRCLKDADDASLQPQILYVTSPAAGIDQSSEPAADGWSDFARAACAGRNSERLLCSQGSARQPCRNKGNDLNGNSLG